MSSKESTAEIGIKVKEDSKNFYFDYDFGGYSWSLIYNKHKDKCLVLRNGKAIDIKKEPEGYIDAFQEVLSFAIDYHHEKGDAEVH